MTPQTAVFVPHKRGLRKRPHWGEDTSPSPLPVHTKPPQGCELEGMWGSDTGTPPDSSLVLWAAPRGWVDLVPPTCSSGGGQSTICLKAETFIPFWGGVGGCGGDCSFFLPASAGAVFCAINGNSAGAHAAALRGGGSAHAGPPGSLPPISGGPPAPPRPRGGVRIKSRALFAAPRLPRALCNPGVGGWGNLNPPPQRTGPPRLFWPRVSLSPISWWHRHLLGCPRGYPPALGSFPLQCGHHGWGVTSQGGGWSPVSPPGKL